MELGAAGLPARRIEHAHGGAPLVAAKRSVDPQLRLDEQHAGPDGDRGHVRGVCPDGSARPGREEDLGRCQLARLVEGRPREQHAARAGRRTAWCSARSPTCRRAMRARTTGGRAVWRRRRPEPRRGARRRSPPSDAMRRSSPGGAYKPSWACPSPAAPSPHRLGGRPAVPAPASCSPPRSMGSGRTRAGRAPSRDRERRGCRRASRGPTPIDRAAGEGPRTAPVALGARSVRAVGPRRPGPSGRPAPDLAASPARRRGRGPAAMDGRSACQDR